MFQTHVNQQPAPAVAGDFASNNPKASLPPSIAGAWKVAPAQSVTVGYFAFGNPNTGLVYSSLAGAGGAGVAVLGFVARQPNEPSVVITTFLAEARMTLEAGMPCTLMTAGDYWANFPAGVVGGDEIFALAATGQPTPDDASGANPATGYFTASVARAPAVTAGTTTIAVNTGIMTVVTMGGGSPAIQVGDRVTGTGVPANTYIESQLTGTPGGAGTYQTTNRNRAAVTAFTATMVQGTLAKISRQYTTPVPA